jgi:IS30 family transposase
MPPDVRQQIIWLRGQGWSYTQIVAELDVSLGTVGRVLQPLGGVIRKDMLAVTGRRLSLEERVEIRLGLERGWSYRRIGQAGG